MSLAGEPRAAFLQRIGDTDPSLRADVESLLAADEAAGSRFLRTPAPAALRFGDPVDCMVGRRIGPYEIVAQIGVGGMGEVYRASRVDQEYHQQVAIKLVRAGQVAPFIAARLRTERQILAGFAHPNIARLLDGGTTQEGIPYLVMELIDGRPISQYCDEHALDTTERLRLFMQVCSAVQYAHQRMVIHRDLKPSNILVTADGVPKLLDFGIAKILEPDTLGVSADLTVNAFHILTPQYASPEQFTGGAVTAVSDVYSLGIILYELLTGVRPYALGDAGNPHEAARLVLTHEPRKPSSVLRSLDGSARRLSRRLQGDLDNIVLMALRKEPERRYAGAEQFAQDIGRHLQHLPVIARKDTLGYRTSRFVRRHIPGVVAAGVILAVLVGGIVMTSREARLAELQRERADRRFRDVRQLANSLIYGIHDSIRDLPGAARSRRMLIDTSLHYLDSLAQESSSSPSLQQELAAGYARLGDIQGQAFEANEGDRAGAQTSYQHALALFQATLARDPGNSDVRREIVVLCGKLSDLLWSADDATGALEYSRLTVTHSEALAATHVGAPAFQKLLATARLDYGFKLFNIKHDRAQAVGQIQPAVSSLEALSASDPGNQRVLRLLSQAYGRLAELLASDEQGGVEVWPIQLKQLHVLDSLVATAPTNGDFSHLRAHAQHYAVGTLLQRGQPEQATTFARSELEGFLSLSSSDPKIEEYHVDIALARGDLARISLRQGDARGALRDLQEALGQMQNVGAGSSSQLRMVQADTQSLLGEATAQLASDTRRDSSRRRHDREESCHHMEEALAVYQDLGGALSQAQRLAQKQSEQLAQCRALMTRT